VRCSRAHTRAVGHWTSDAPVQVSVLGSGSRGNALLVESGDTRVLVDCGFGPRAIARRLALLHRAPESIDALVLTHEHTDHAQGAMKACAKWGWPLYATAGTLAALPAPLSPVRVIAHGQPWSVGTLDGCSIAVPHDAADCAALRFDNRATGQRVGVALDLGHVPAGLAAFFALSDLLVIEANHDLAMLHAGPYPRRLKERIRGRRGHLDNGAAAELIAHCAHRGLRGVVLAHLSETNNAPAEAVRAVQEIAVARLAPARWAQTAVHAASQREPLGPVVAATVARRDRAPVQTELSL
jgi:phosphoribosyl 1,2-cyclic phosphodiesterase